MIDHKEYLDRVESDITEEIDKSYGKFKSGSYSRCETGIAVLIKEIALLRLGLDKIMNDLYRLDLESSKDMN